MDRRLVVTVFFAKIIPGSSAGGPDAAWNGSPVLVAMGPGKFAVNFVTPEIVILDSLISRFQNGLARDTCRS